MEFFCRVTPAGLVPLDDIDAERKARLRLGSDVKVTITRPRNIGFHRKFFALLTLALQNMPESIARRNGIFSVESMLNSVKVDLGHYDVVRLAGRELIKPRSISFASMSDDEFQKFYDLTVTDVLNNYLKGTNREDLIQEVEQFISNQI